MNGKKEEKYTIYASYEDSEIAINCPNSLVLSIAISSILKHTNLNVIKIEEEK